MVFVDPFKNSQVDKGTGGKITNVFCSDLMIVCLTLLFCFVEGGQRQIGPPNV